MSTSVPTGTTCVSQVIQGKVVSNLSLYMLPCRMERRSASLHGSQHLCVSYNLSRHAKAIVRALADGNCDVQP